MTTRYTITTANQPGAVGIVQVSGEADAVVGVLEKLTAKRDAPSRGLTGPGGAAHDTPEAACSAKTYVAPPGAVSPRLLGTRNWQVGRLRLCDFADIDEGLAGLISPTTAQLMPHGGPRVMQKLTAWLRDLGIPPEAEIDSATRYPEAASPIEADTLHAIAAAASPAAIDRLAAQPTLWRNWFSANLKSEIRNLKSLHHLIAPPTVVVVGRPNVGKSTLLNQLLGRSASVVADLPGTTRDWVGGLVELCPQHSGGDPLRDAVAVRWLDTPGLRDSDDAVEQRAIEQARGVVASADVLVVMRDPEIDWPDIGALPRTPDVWVVNKADVGNAAAEPHAIAISAAQGRGIDTLTQAVLAVLGITEIDREALWAFSPTLYAWAQAPESINEKAAQVYLHGPS